MFNNIRLSKGAINTDYNIHPTKIIFFISGYFDSNYLSGSGSVNCSKGGGDHFSPFICNRRFLRFNYPKMIEPGI